jgi:HK97 family phage major capsid protein
VSFTDVIDRPGASALIPQEQAREIIQLLPQSSVALRLARRAPNMSAHQRQVPVLSVLPMAYFVNGDGGLKRTTKTGWEGLMLTAEEIATIVPIHENVLNDSAYPLWQEIRPQIAAAIGLTLDRAVFFGTNRPASWPLSVDQGARATTPANSMVVTRPGRSAAEGGVSGDLSDLYSAVERKGYEVSGLLLNPIWRGFIRQARNTQGDQLAELLSGDVYGFEPTYGLRGGWSAGANVTEGFAGDFSQMIIAIREDMDWLISREAVITDENNEIVLNLFQADSVALRVKFRVAMQIAQPVTPEVGVKASRYPFAVIQGTGAVAYEGDDEDAETAEAEEEEAAAGSRRKR